MAGHKPWREMEERLRAKIPDFDAQREPRQKQVREELATYQRGLARVRKARQRTQVEVASALGIPQAQVSRLEHQADAYLSTLRKYINGLGGELELVAVFDDARIVFELPQLTEVEAEAEPEPELVR